MGGGSAATDEGDDFDGIAFSEGVSIMLYSWDKLAVHFDGAWAVAESKFTEQVLHVHWFRKRSDFAIDGDLHVRILSRGG